MKDDGQSPDHLHGDVGEAENLYARLATTFDVTFWDNRGGIDLEYVTGEQVTSRLNQELGFMNWSFRITEHGISHEADEAWVVGALTVTIDGQTAVRQQFGSQKVKRKRSDEKILDIGFDLKGAATDSLKKCASLIGVGLWLSAKEAGPDGKPIPKGRPERRRPSADSRLRQMANDAAPVKPAPPVKPTPAAKATPAKRSQEPTPLRPAAPLTETPAEACKECGAEIWPDREVKIKEKTITGADLIEKSQVEFKKVLCLTCFGRYWAGRSPKPANAGMR